MKRNLGVKVFAMLAVLLMASLVFVPAVSAAEQLKSTTAGEVTETAAPQIEIKENTRTSQIVQVGDILITLKSDSKHTSAVMTIEDLKTNEKETINYKISKKSGKYNTEVYYNGKLANSYVADYDPLEPGAMKQALKSNSNVQGAANTNGVTIQATTTYYIWDGVSFMKGYGIKYPHPNYARYGLFAWETRNIPGTNLNHYHINKYDSDAYMQYSAVFIGVLIAVRIGGIGGIYAGLVSYQHNFFTYICYFSA